MIDITRPLRLKNGTPLTNVRLDSLNSALFLADAPSAQKSDLVFRVADGTSVFGTGDAEYGLDLTKPVQTRGGLPARVLATDLKGRTPIVAVVDGFFHPDAQTVLHFRPDGTLSSLGTSDGDLVNVPEAPRKRTFSVYFDPTGEDPDLGVNDTRYGTVCGRLTIDVTVDAYGVPTAVELVSNA